MGRGTKSGDGKMNNNIKIQLKQMFKYQDKVNKGKKYKKKFIKKMNYEICFFAYDFKRQENTWGYCCDNEKDENKMCYGCKIINFYRQYIRKYSTKKRSILMKLRHEVMKDND